MVIIRGRFKWKQGEAPLAAIGALTARIRASHRGNIDYRIAIDSGDSSQMFLNEMWEAQDDFVEHGKSEEVRELVAMLHGRVSNVALNLHGVASTTELTVDLGQT